MLLFDSSLSIIDPLTKQQQCFLAVTHIFPINILVVFVWRMWRLISPRHLAVTLRRGALSLPVRTNLVMRRASGPSFQQSPTGSSIKKRTTYLLKVAGLCFSLQVLGVAAGAVLHFAAERDKLTINERDFPLDYCGDDMEAYWSQHTAVVINRVGEVVLLSMPFIFNVLSAAAKNYFSPPISVVESQQKRADEQRKLAVQLRELLVSLGPAFIKLGQVLSTRPDFFPTPVLQELQALCDSVPSFPTPHALQVIEQELGKPVHSVFVGLDETSVPVAAASLGQVYKCKMHKDNGELVDVALKVQRPDMIQAVSLDLFVMRNLMHYIESTKGFLMKVGILARRKQFNVSMFDAFASASYSEVDYEHEATNQETFAEKIKQRGMSKVHIPLVYREGTRRRILSTEWINGTQLSKSDPDVIRKLITVGVECFLCQLLDMGFFHGDPHSGNLLVNEKGHLVLIDFGLCAVVDMPSTVVLTTSLVHLMQGNTSELINDLIELGFLPVDVDKVALLPILDTIFTKARLARAENGGKGFQSEKLGQQFKAVSSQLNEVFFEFPFVVPEYFALITRALIVLEGIAVIGDPSFDIFSASYPYAAKKAVLRGFY